MKNLKVKIITSLSLVAVMMLMTPLAGAQDNKDEKQAKKRTAEFGVRFMPTISAFKMQTSTGGTVSGQANLGFGVGAFVGFNFNDYVGIQGEVNYSAVSRQYSEFEVEKKISLRYINIPILFSLNTGKTKRVNLNLVAGPQLGINVGSKVYTSGSDDGTIARPVLAVKKSDLGFAYGVGLDFGLNEPRTFRLGLGFRGVYGLVDISDNNTSTTTDSYYILDRAHIQTYSIYAGLSFLF